MSLFRRTSTDSDFWDWFARNQSRIALGPSGGPMLGRDITVQLRRVHPGLAWEMGKLASGENEFAVSADGDLKVAPVVRRLVAAAPKIPGWNIVAFRQKDDRAPAAQYGGEQVSRRDLLLGNEIYVKDGQIGLTLYIQGLEKNNYDGKVGAAVLLLDSVVGEELAMTKIGSLEYRPWSERKGSELHIDELQRVLLTS